MFKTLETASAWAFEFRSFVIMLAQELWDGLAAQPNDVVVTEAQQADVQRRLNEYRDDRHAGSTWEEVRARLQRE